MPPRNTGSLPHPRAVTGQCGGHIRLIGIDRKRGLAAFCPDEREPVFKRLGKGLMLGQIAIDMTLRKPELRRFARGQGHSVEARPLRVVRLDLCPVHAGACTHTGP